VRDTWTRIVRVAKATAGRFARHRMLTYAAALAYSSVLALFPFLLLIVGVATAFRLDAFIAWITARAAAGQVSGERGALMRWIVEELQRPRSGSLLSVGVVTALWSVSGGVRRLREALAAAAEVADTDQAPMWRRLANSIGVAPLLVAIVILAGASLLVTSHAIETVFRWLRWDVALGAMLAWLRVPVVLVVIALLLATVYRFTPGARQPLRRVAPGALLAAVSWTAMSRAFSVALATVLDYGATYGSFGAAIALLVYLQLSAAIVLVGAEVNAVLQRERVSGPRAPSGRGFPARPKNSSPR
jgi:membrane protein